MNLDLLFVISFRVKKYFLFISLFWVAATNCQLSEQPKIVFNTQIDDRHYGSVEVRGIDFPLDRLQSAKLSTSQWQEFFPVYTGREIPKDPKHPPIMGSYFVDGEIIRFQPRFPFVAGLTYSAMFDGNRFYTLIGKQSLLGKSKTKEVTHTFPPKESIATTYVENIYPSTNKIPENLLKLYIHFSAPMSRGNVYQFVYLVDESGQKVKQPFLEIDQEFWDPASKRLTIFFDPGRIKRGLRPHNEMGLALKPGKYYRVVIDKDLQDAEGNPMVSSHEKKFYVKQADRISPDIKSWQVKSPNKLTKLPVSLTFPESLDHALLNRLITVRDSSNNILDGTVHISKMETQWSFKPIDYWNGGNYVIHVQTTLEDLAGNNLKSVFDADMRIETDRLTDKDFITIPFIVK